MSKNQIIDGIETDSEPLAFDLFAQPFRILCIDPEAASRQVHDAFDIAHERRLVSDDILISARSAILDPSRRLSYELSYLIDSQLAEIDALYAILSSDASAKELLRLRTGSRLYQGPILLPTSRPIDRQKAPCFGRSLKRMYPSNRKGFTRS
jgi:hypothetical protein